jgi:hypothetical protein
VATVVVTLIGNLATAWYAQVNVFFLRLDLRLHHRAMFLALKDLVTRISDHLESGEIQTLPRDEEYLDLHAALGFIWTTRMHAARNMRAMFSIALVVELIINPIITIAVSGCVPAWTLVSSLWVVLLMLKELFETAMGNAEVETLSKLYRSAAAEIRLCLLRAPFLGSPNALEMRDSVRAHVDILDSLAVERDHTARFLGFVVSFGSLRSLLVTSLTVLVALWSIMRGFGLRLTIECACPNQG